MQEVDGIVQRVRSEHDDERRLVARLRDADMQLESLQVC